MPEPWAAPSVTTVPATELVEHVLASVGASLPRRDSVDTRLVEHVRTRTGRIIDSQKEVGGWPVLKSAPAPADSDNDGIPDEWETRHGLNPRDASDAARVGKSGYTPLEDYLNRLAQ